jgi:gamma-glutamyltranspeptidase/glutathione hydrolase
MQSSFGAHQAEPGRIEVTPLVTDYTREQLEKMGYKVELVPRTYNPTTAIWFDHEHDTMYGAASDFGDDYGVAW